MDLLNHIRDTVATVKAALADGKITGAEALEIVKSLIALAGDLLGKSETPVK
jgi:hypothetical protein